MLAGFLGTLYGYSGLKDHMRIRFPLTCSMALGSFLGGLLAVDDQTSSSGLPLALRAVNPDWISSGVYLHFSATGGWPNERPPAAREALPNSAPPRKERLPLYSTLGLLPTLDLVRVPVVYPPRAANRPNRTFSGVL